MSVCELESLCATPTERRWYAYEPKTDTYAKPESERLRPAITEWPDEDPECP